MIFAIVGKDTCAGEEKVPCNTFVYCGNVSCTWVNPYTNAPETRPKGSCYLQFQVLFNEKDPVRISLANRTTLGSGEMTPVDNRVILGEG
jgi:hypothetical protein